ncbi:MAG TPA: alpha/beta fold hydrolase [Amaricoccus sp.]|nr:alpha/beta fold hydrolase [Amaricoccus sp.]
MTRLAPLLLTLLLLACARAPAPSALAPEPLPLHTWPARGEPRAVILALHGFGDAGDLTFEDAARAWSARGIAVYAPDQRGFGANASRHDWPGVDALAGDAVALSRSLRARHPGLPLVVVGHSMGGGVALVAAADGLDADALVLAGPAIAGGEALSPLYRTAARIAAAAAPEKHWTGEGLIAIRPSDNPEAIARVMADPRHFGDPTSRELYGLVELMDRAADAAPAVTLPTLVLMGTHDEVLRPARVRKVSDRIPDAHFILYPDGWHWLFRDLQAPRVWQDVGDFVLSGAARP